MIHISLLSSAPKVGVDSVVYFTNKESIQLPAGLSVDESMFVSRQKELENNVIQINRGSGFAWIVLVDSQNIELEKFRNLGVEISKLTQLNKLDTLSVDGSELRVDQVIAFSEGYALSSYRFLPYFKEKDKKKKQFTVSQLSLFKEGLRSKSIAELNNIIKSVFWARDMVNEPVCVMNASRLAKEIVMRGKESGFDVEVLDKEKIKSLRMGGLLAVNEGSIDPPTFTICSWKPEKAVNKKPFVLVGKGVVYDTGGLSLKPTANSMDSMKSDMAGAAAVAASMYSIALNKLNVWVIALLPATDNRPSGNAYTPGDVITMYNGLHVEVLNTDAEGRMILADALSYGDKFDPQLIIDMATLTGSAHSAIGSQASVFMGNADKSWFDKLFVAADSTHERLVQFPFWDEYGELVKSDIADLKNLGGPTGGAITAGKFLENFTKSPYIHVDIAGTAFLSSSDTYRTKGGTGVGVRLMTEFFKNVANKSDKN